MTDLLQHPFGESIGDADNRPGRLSVPAVNPSLDAHQLRIGGFIPTTTIDYPDHLAAVIFTQGCPWRCRYCHNSHLASWEQHEEFPWEDIYSLLKRRRNLLDGVVFSGGEPTAQAALTNAMSAVSDLGMNIALHSGGPFPERFEKALEQVSWVGFDIKGLPSQYPDITQGDNQAGSNAWKSLRILLNSKVPYEVRTTVHWSLFSKENLLQLARALQNIGVSKYIIQLARPDNMLDSTLGGTIPPAELPPFWEELKGMFEQFEVRQ